MDYNFDYISLSKTKEKPTRFHHTLGVINEAISLAKKYKVDPLKAKISAALHDITKNEPIEWQKETITKYYGEEYLSLYPTGAYHSLTGRIYAEKELHIDDMDILLAIENHTLGRPNMNTLEKIIFIADFIEPSRDSYESQVAKKLAYTNLNMALCYIMKYTIDMHEKAKRMVPKIAYEALKFYEDGNK